MVQIKEFFLDWHQSSRIVMPMSLAEYEIAQMHMILKMQQQNTTTSEGVDILESRAFEDDVFGKGYYTSKMYRFQSKIPSWLTTFARADSLLLKEEAWNAYPKCKSVIKCPSFSKLLLTVETVHLADNGHSENAHGLNKEQMAMRQVEVIDIASSVRDYWSNLVGCCNVDLSRFQSARANRGPLVEGWRECCSPVMTAYKLVIVDAPYWGFGKRLEQALLAGERALFLESHRNCFAWIDEWYGMEIERFKQLEQQFYSTSSEVQVKSVPLVRVKDGCLDRRCSLESEDAFRRNPHLQYKDRKSAISMPD